MSNEPNAPQSDTAATMAASEPSVPPELSTPSPLVRWSLTTGRLVLVLVLALGFTTGMLLAAGTSPLAAYRLIFLGAFLSSTKFADMVMLASPLLLCAAGLTLTFSVGLYNLGIEGKVTIGAVCAMIPLRMLQEMPPLFVWVLAFGAAIIGGMLWGILIAALKHYGRVSEIFAGLGMNFLATGVALYLVFGPWKRPGIASMSGTERLPDPLWLPTLEGVRLAPAAPVIALGALVLVWFALSRTHWGLSLRAAGQTPRAAERLGVPSTRRLFEAMAACGALAGVAGAVQVLGVFHALVPNISSGIGLLGLLIVLLVQWQPVWVLPVVLAFASFTVGGIGLPLQLEVDSSISGVLQGALVLFALAVRGFSGTRR